jgi:hypothetical protein
LSELAARGNKVLLKNGFASDCDVTFEKEPKEFKARVGLSALLLRCAACRGYSVHVARERNGEWIVRQCTEHGRECAGGNLIGITAAATHRALILSGAAKKQRGKNPHHRHLPFEAQHFIAMVAEVLSKDLHANKRGHSSASIDALVGLVQPFVHQPVPRSFVKRARSATLKAMYGNPTSDVTLIPGIAIALEEVGYVVTVHYKNRGEAIALALGAQKVRTRLSLSD